VRQKPREQPFRQPPQGRGRWGWTGFGNKTLWDWLQLLVVPAMLAIVGAGFTAALGYIQLQAEESRAQAQRDAEESRAQAQRDAEESRAQDEALQAYIEGMGNLLLDEGLLSSQEDDEMRTLARARTLTILGRVDGARKRTVVQFLYESQLVEKDQPIVRLNAADLRDANLIGADLSGANLSSVHGVTLEELEDHANSVSGATMPDGSPHP
jgi:hypothetical protein